MKPAFLALVLLTAQALAPEVEITAESHHHLAFENGSVRVFNFDLPAHSETLMHWHRHDYIGVSLGASEIVNIVKDKPPVTVKLQDGQTGFTSAPLGHIVRTGDRSVHNVTVEILEDAKLRNAPTKWDPDNNEDRGLEILTGGTQQILFVQDGVRASEIELQPGGVVPMHHHAGPHLLIAVSDLQIRSDAEGQGPTPWHFKSGESKWLPGNYSHKITNTGKKLAKFVTLEFP